MKTPEEIKKEPATRYEDEIKRLEAERADIVKRHEGELLNIDDRITEAKVRYDAMKK